jgi:NAD+ kinase
MKTENVIIFTKPRQAQVARVAAELIEWFSARKVRASIAPLDAAKADIAVIVGGDGTLLAAARQLGDRQVPILAINYGGLGFLTEVTMEEMYPALERVLAGDFAVEERMMIDVAFARGHRHIATHRALNDIVINRGTLSRLVELEARVNGDGVSLFRSDGLIVATPTGSTAYNLSAGGPIIFPTMSAMVLTPICSHTLTNRPIVLSSDVRIEITLQSSQEEEVYTTVDGQVGLKMQPGDLLTIVKSKVAVKLIAPADRNYFDVLRGKLKWG